MIMAGLHVFVFSLQVGASDKDILEAAEGANGNPIVVLSGE